MELEIPRNKIYNHPQTLTLDSSVMTFVGENGCGKSAILESIFKKYLLLIFIKQSSSKFPFNFINQIKQ